MKLEEITIDWLADRLGVASGVLVHILATVAVLVSYGIARRLVARALSTAISDRAVRFSAVRAMNYALGLFSLAIVARIWLQAMAGIATYLGLLSAGIAVALQEPIANLVAFGFILWRRPFEVGNRIEIGSYAGDVIDVSLFQFTMLEIGKWVKSDQSTGRVLHIPNGWVFKHPVANFSKGFDHIWNEISVTVTFESNWRRAKDVLSEILSTSVHASEEAIQAQLDAASNPYFIKYSNLRPIVWTSVADDGIVLTLRYLCNPRHRRSSEHELWERILERFAELDDVDLAYRTYRLFQNMLEGKPGARATGEKGEKAERVQLADRALARVAREPEVEAAAQEAAIDSGGSTGPKSGSFTP